MVNIYLSILRFLRYRRFWFWFVIVIVFGFRIVVKDDMELAGNKHQYVKRVGRQWRLTCPIKALTTLTPSAMLVMRTLKSSTGGRSRLGEITIPSASRFIWLVSYSVTL